MEVACRGEISFAPRRRSNSAPTRAHKSLTAMEEVSRSKMVVVKRDSLRNRFTIGLQPFRCRYRLYPIYRGKRNLGTVGLNFRVPIGCRRFRFLLRGEPKLDALLP